MAPFPHVRHDHPFALGPSACRSCVPRGGLGHSRADRAEYAKDCIVLESMQSMAERRTAWPALEHAFSHHACVSCCWALREAGYLLSKRTQHAPYDSHMEAVCELRACLPQVQQHIGWQGKRACRVMLVPGSIVLKPHFGCSPYLPSFTHSQPCKGTERSAKAPLAPGMPAP